MYTMQRIKNLQTAIEDAIEQCEMALEELNKIRSEQKDAEDKLRVERALLELTGRIAE